ALEEGLVINHPFVAGELACGNLANRAEVLSLLQSLAQAPLVPDAKALVFIESRALMGRGIGYIHVHLLASAALHADAKL
ncbi:MAG: VapC toxin family PIN domain ribonuclease, partial [Anaerolineae bacterium]|nr:VapC toxin family PIN domain ribonuclease [Anaerolineae bacterium]